MNKRFLPAALLALSLLLVIAGLAFAHGHVTAGDYDIVIGFHNEPVIQGEPNSLDLFVTNSKTNEKVNGLENTLQAEIIYGTARQTLKIQPQEDLDGAYSADLLPTAAGDYTWHITGKIKDQVVDVTMTSGPDTFGAVQPKSDFSFPAKDVSTVDLAGQVSTALTVGIVGVVLGLAGLVVGLLGYRKGHS